ncbi:unannotated protein [freshwater metagenome]|uniref:Unannotated protein n=1 Tax=freshwater metagenome TaxID=449393 RepID=A0A6J7UUU7_9ZZZZ
MLGPIENVLQTGAHKFGSTACHEFWASQRKEIMHGCNQGGFLNRGAHRNGQVNQVNVTGSRRNFRPVGCSPCVVEKRHW